MPQSFHSLSYPLLVFVFPFIFLNRLCPVLSVPITSPDDLTLAEIQSQWNISSWSGPPDCSRQGIGCDRFNRVISIQIQGSLDDPAGTYANPPLTFPAAVMNLTSLQSYVQIGADASRGPSGTIPSGFWLLPALHTVKFAYSSFSGTFPTTLRSVLTSVDLCDNQFSGVLPLGVITARLNTLVLAGNSFSGVLPSFASALALIYLDLSDNGFFGDFPVTLTDWPSLRQVTLYKNQLTGTIPVDLPMSLPVLVDSNVGFNLLSGSIPDFAQSNLNTLLLNNNRDLNGTFPISLTNCTSLSTLNINATNIGGAAPIPSWICNITSLVQLSMQVTNFDGPMPSCLNQLVNLKQLYLSDRV